MAERELSCSGLERDAVAFTNRLEPTDARPDIFGYGHVVVRRATSQIAWRRARVSQNSAVVRTPHDKADVA